MQENIDIQSVSPFSPKGRLFDFSGSLAFFLCSTTNIPFETVRGSRGCAHVSLDLSLPPCVSLASHLWQHDGITLEPSPVRARVVFLLFFLPTGACFHVGVCHPSPCSGLLVAPLANTQTMRRQRRHLPRPLARCTSCKHTNDEAAAAAFASPACSLYLLQTHKR